MRTDCQQIEFNDGTEPISAVVLARTLECLVVKKDTGSYYLISRTRLKEPDKFGFSE